MKKILQFIYIYICLFYKILLFKFLQIFKYKRITYNDSYCKYSFNLLNRKYYIEISEIKHKLYHIQFYYLENDNKITNMRNLTEKAVKKLIKHLYNIVEYYFLDFNLNGIMLSINKNENKKLYDFLPYKYLKNLKYNFKETIIDNIIYLFIFKEDFNLNEAYYIRKFNIISKNKHN